MREGATPKGCGPFSHIDQLNVARDRMFVPLVVPALRLAAKVSRMRPGGKASFLNQATMAPTDGALKARSILSQGRRP